MYRIYKNARFVFPGSYADKAEADRLCNQYNAVMEARAYVRKVS
jgi:hypothetical protein